MKDNMEVEYDEWKQSNINTSLQIECSDQLALNNTSVDNISNNNSLIFIFKSFCVILLQTIVIIATIALILLSIIIFVIFFVKIFRYLNFSVSFTIYIVTCITFTIFCVINLIIVLLVILCFHYSRINSVVK